MSLRSGLINWLWAEITRVSLLKFWLWSTFLIWWGHLCRYNTQQAVASGMMRSTQPWTTTSECYVMGLSRGFVDDKKTQMKKRCSCTRWTFNVLVLVDQFCCLVLICQYLLKNKAALLYYWQRLKLTTWGLCCVVSSFHLQIIVFLTEQDQVRWPVWFLQDSETSVWLFSIRCWAGTSNQCLISWIRVWGY